MCLYVDIERCLVSLFFDRFMGLIGPLQRIDRIDKEFPASFCKVCFENMCLAICQDPRVFGKLGQACWNHFHLSRYLSDFTVPSYGKKQGKLCFPSTA